MKYEFTEENKMLIEFGTDDYNKHLKTAMTTFMESILRVQAISCANHTESEEDIIFKRTREAAQASPSPHGKGGESNPDYKPTHSIGNAPQTLPPLPSSNYSEVGDEETDKVTSPLPPLEDPQEEIMFEDDI